MKISYTINPDLKPKEVVTLFVNSDIRRPTRNIKRIKMVENADLTICAREGKKLVGILRAVTDYSYCCYVSDIAVDKKYKRLGIGKKLLKMTQKTLGATSHDTFVISTRSRLVLFTCRIGKSEKRLEDFP